MENHGKLVLQILAEASNEEEGCNTDRREYVDLRNPQSMKKSTLVVLNRNSNRNDRNKKYFLVLLPLVIVFYVDLFEKLQRVFRARSWP